MPPEQPETQQQEQAQGNETQPTVADLQDQLRRLDAAHKKTTKESENRRLELERRDAEAQQARDKGLGEPDKLARSLNETREALARAERERDEERAGRKADRQERQILAASTGGTSPIDPRFADLAYGLIDRTFLEVDEDTGKITKGIDKALEDLAKRRPEMAKAKPKDQGSGPRHPHRGGGNAEGQTPFERSLNPPQNQPNQ